MKPDSEKYFATLATANLKNGDSTAIDKATRILALTGSPRALEIVTAQYSTFDPFHLARMAAVDCWHGGARALVIAQRIDALTGGQFDAESIVTRVYCRSDGKAVFECRECGTSHLTSEDACQCCAPCDDWEEFHPSTFGELQSA